MNRTVLLLWGITTISALTVLGLMWPSAAAARTAARTAESALADAVRHAESIASLKSGLPSQPTLDQARGGLAPRVTAALDHAGLPPSLLAGVSPEAQTQVASHRGLRARTRATLTLSGATLPQVGKFLDLWRTSSPEWIPISIDLSPAGLKPPEAGGDLPLRAVITIETTTVRHEGDHE